MKIIFPDYSNCPVQVANSILGYFNCPQYHEGNPIIDNILKKNNYKHVILFLLDGLGTKQLKEHLSENDFLRKHHYTDYSSVFPPTTTASTTTITTGLMPCEHGWLGWNLYLEEKQDIVTLFRNTIKDQTEQIPGTNDYAEDVIPNKMIHHLINEKGDGKGYFLFPFKWTIFRDKLHLEEQLMDLCSKDEKNYVYVYDTQPDYDMHGNGCHSEIVNKQIKLLNDFIEKIAEKVEDTLIIVTADHGHLDVEPMYVSDYPELEKLLIRKTSVESRACAFYVKEGMHQYFEKLFYQFFGKDNFILYTKEQVKKLKLFGTKGYRSNVDAGIGDYLAVAINNKMILDSPAGFIPKSQHAGLTEDEMIIPLILIDCK